MNLPPEILKKVKLLDLQVRKKVNNMFAGQYHSAFKGQGMTFSEFREYVPGDDIRTISWPIMARTGTPYIKKFDEEREQTLMLAVDISGSGNFGTGKYLKAESMIYLSALLGFSAVKNNDAVGLVLFSDQIEHYVPPKKGRGHILRIMRDLYYFQAKSKKTNLAAPMEFLQGVLKKRSNIFIFSDFMGDSYEYALRQLGKKHEAIAVVVTSNLEQEMPDLGVAVWEDSETGKLITIDTSSNVYRENYKKHQLREKEAREQTLIKAQVECIYVDSCSEDITAPLINFFKKRG